MSILFEQGGDGFIVASVPEVPGALTQGRTREEARANVVDALRLMSRPSRARTSSKTVGPDYPETSLQRSWERDPPKLIEQAANSRSVQTRSVTAWRAFTQGHGRPESPTSTNSPAEDVS